MKSIKREARTGVRPQLAATNPVASWSRIARYAAGIVILSIEPGDLCRDAGRSSLATDSTARSKHA
jgi:hypothetical protein